MSKRILYVGPGPSLLLPRLEALRSTGYEVATASNFVDVMAACEAKSFDLVVICATLPTNEKRRIGMAVQGQCGDAKVLTLRRHPKEKLNDLGHVLDALRGPAGFVDAIDKIMAA